MNEIAARMRMEMRGDRHADLGREAADEIERLENVAQFLWARLDDIDSVSDIVKADNTAYREAVERIQRRRFDVGVTDGYSVTLGRVKP
jgi:hypothetical protein